MIRFIHIALMAGLLVTAISVAAGAGMYKGYETPSYAVVARDGAFEQRRYDTHLVAEVRVAGDRKSAIGRGFRILANYIFGGNVEDTKVAMTSPVSQTGNDAGEWTVRFMMPSGYTSETVPAPTSSTINFVEVAPEDQVVVRFSGRWSDAGLAKKEAELRDYAQSKGLEIMGAAKYYFYDDPFTLPWNRRNEVAFAVN